MQQVENDIHRLTEQLEAKKRLLNILRENPVIEEAFTLISQSY